MTSTNDGKEVNSNQTSAPKGKSYYIELYKSLEAGLSEVGTASEHTNQLCEAWRRVHSLCLHSTPSTHPHLLTWLQRHTARTVLQTEWQSSKRKDDRTSLEEAINVFIVESRTAAATRTGPSPSWETQLVARGEWFKKILDNPWKHPVLNCLLNPGGTPPTNEEVLKWLTEERGVTFVMRLHTLVSEKCDDIAVSLATAVMERVRATSEQISDLEQAEEPKDKAENPKRNFGDRLTDEAGFTVDVWEMLTDIEFVLLHKRDSSKCIALAKLTPLRSAHQLIERLQSRLDTSPREKRLWKNSKDVAILIAQVVIARCMVVPRCTGGVRSALYRCARSLARLVSHARLPAAARALAAPAPTAQHLHMLAAAIDAHRAQQKDANMKPFVCELYVRAITAGMNELERLKLKAEKDTEARSMEATLAGWFVQLGNVLGSSARVACECALTAFSLHPSRHMYERIQAARHNSAQTDAEEQPNTEATNAEFGSWASDSRSQTNFVKTSETLKMKAKQKQAHVVSTAILNDGEALGLSAELCQDIAVLLSGPRVKTLSWDMDRELLLENCRAYMERTNGGTKALTTELKFLNLDPSKFLHLPEEDDDENNIYYGIEKGYEHLVEFPEPEDIWQDAIIDNEKTDTASSSEEYSQATTTQQRKKKTKRIVINSDEEEDPLSLVAEIKRIEKTERTLSKERSKKKSVKDAIEDNDKHVEEKKLPEKKERKRKEKVPKPQGGPLSKLLGLRVAKKKKAPKPLQAVLVNDYDSQGKSSLQYFNSEVNKSQHSSQSSDNVGLAREHDFSKASGMEITRPSQVHFNRPFGPPIVSSAQMQSPSDHLRNASPTFVSEEVKTSITKLLEFRRQKTLNFERKAPNTIRRPEVPDKDVISPKAVVIPEIPKSYINKQNDRLTELQQQVNDILSHRSSAAATLPSPFLQYATPSKQNLISPSPYNNNQRPSMSDQFMKSVNMVSICDKNELHHSQSRPFYDLPQDKPKSNQGVNYHDFLHEYHNSFNTFNVADRQEQKKVIRPVSKVTPVHMIKSEKSPQSAKQIQQKKPDGSLNTFSRLSYYKNKQTDMRNKTCAQSPTSSKTVGSKLEGFILNHLHQSQDKSQNSFSETQKAIGECDTPKVRDHPTLANILQGSSPQKPVSPPRNTLSEKDQHDLILLLRQQNLLNKPVASSTRTAYPIESQNMPSNPQSNMNETETKNIAEGKMMNVVSNTVLSLEDSAMTRHPKQKSTNPKKPRDSQLISQSKKTERHNDRTKKSAAKPEPKDTKEWENVMNALAKHKTPCRGPNALDMALNKSSFEKAFEDSLRKPSSFFTTTKISSTEIIKSSETDYQCHVVNITKSTSRSSINPVIPITETKTPNTVNKTPHIPKPKPSNSKNMSSKISPNPMIENVVKQNNVEIVKKDTKAVHTNKTRDTSDKNVKLSNIGKRTQKVSKRDPKNAFETCTMVHQEKHPKQYTNAVKLDPYTLGIPNSDYDLLEELMDDDLRKEIGELSSDDESYSTAARNFLKDSNNVEKRVSVVFNDGLDATTPKEKSMNSTAQTICENDILHSYAQKTTETLLKTILPKPIRNETSDREINELNVQNISTHIATSQAYNNVNMLQNTQISIEPNVFITALPQSAPLQNVVLIGSDLVYEGYGPVQTPIQSATHIASNTYMAMESVPNMNVYNTTQFTSIGPVILATTVTVPIMTNNLCTTTPMQSNHITSVTQSTYSYASTEVNYSSLNVDLSRNNTSVNSNRELEDSNITTPIQNDNDANFNKYGERKVFIEVQDKNADEETYCKRRCSNDKELKNQADLERVRKKRLAILNREIKQLCGNGMVIALEYSPLHPVTKKDNEKCTDIKNVIDVNVVPSINNTIQELEVKSPAASNSCKNYKENENEIISCRRILLRSSNKLKCASSLPLVKPTTKLNETVSRGSPNKSTENDKDDTDKNKTKRVSKRIRNKSTTTAIVNNKTLKNVSTKSAEQLDLFKDANTSVTPSNNSEEQLEVAVKMRNNREEPIEVNEESLKKSDVNSVPVDDILRTDINVNDEIEKRIIDNNEVTLSSDNGPKCSKEDINKKDKQKYDDSGNITNYLNMCLAEGPNVLITSEQSTQTNEDLVRLSDILIETEFVRRKEDQDTHENHLMEIINKDALVTEPIITKALKIDNVKINNNVPKLPSTITVEKGILREVDILEVNLLTGKLPAGTEQGGKITDDEKKPKEIKKSSNTKEIKKALEEKSSSVISRIKATNKHFGCNKIGSMKEKNKETRAEVDNDVAVVDVVQKPLEKHLVKSTEKPVTVIKHNSTKPTTTYSEYVLSASHIKKVNTDLPSKTSIEQKSIKAKEHATNKSSHSVKITKSQSKLQKQVTNPNMVSIKNTSNINSSNESALHLLKNSITIEQLPSKPGDDPLKKTVRIKHINGKVFKGTVRGPINVDAILKDPKLHSLLLTQFEQSKKRYTLKVNVNQVVTKGVSGEVLTTYLQPITKPDTAIETVNLLSDDEEESISPAIQTFETEYGKYKTQSMDNDLFTKHQNKLKLKSHVPLVKISQRRFSYRCLKKTVVNKTNVIKVESPVTQILCSEILNDVKISPAIRKKYVENSFSDFANNLTPKHKMPATDSDVVLIDDSSNDSVEQNKKTEPKEKIDELKNMLLRDLGVVNKVKKIVQPTSKVTDDILVTLSSDAIDLTDDSVVMEPANKENLINKDYVKIMNRKCFVKLVRCDYNVTKSKSLKDLHTEDATKQSEEINEMMLKPLSRSGSFSLLEDFPILDDIPIKEISTPEYELKLCSPVMELHAALDGKLLTNHNASEPFMASSKCDAEWMTTKMAYTLLNDTLTSEYQNNVKIYENDCVLAKTKSCQTFDVLVPMNCDAEWLSSKHLAHELSLKQPTCKISYNYEPITPNNFIENKSQTKNSCHTVDVPKLSTMVLQYIQKEDFLSLLYGYSKYNLPYATAILSPNFLKRKLDSVTSPVAKITRLNYEHNEPQGFSSFSEDTALYLATQKVLVNLNNLKFNYPNNKLENDSIDIDIDFQDIVMANVTISNNIEDSKMLKDKTGIDIALSKQFENVVDASVNKLLKENEAADVHINAEINDATTESSCKISTRTEVSGREQDKAKELFSNVATSQSQYLLLNNISGNCPIADAGSSGKPICPTADDVNTDEINAETESIFNDITGREQTMCNKELVRNVAAGELENLLSDSRPIADADIIKLKNETSNRTSCELSIETDMNPATIYSIADEDIRLEINETSAESSCDISTENYLISAGITGQEQVNNPVKNVAPSEPQYQLSNNDKNSANSCPVADSDITEDPLEQICENPYEIKTGAKSICDIGKYENDKCGNDFLKHFHTNQSPNPVVGKVVDGCVTADYAEKQLETPTEIDLVTAMCTISDADNTKEQCKNEKTSEITNVLLNDAELMTSDIANSENENHVQDFVNQYNTSQLSNPGSTADITEVLLETTKETSYQASIDADIVKREQSSVNTNELPCQFPIVTVNKVSNHGSAEINKEIITTTEIYKFSNDADMILADNAVVTKVQHEETNETLHVISVDLVPTDIACGDVKCTEDVADESNKCAIITDKKLIEYEYIDIDENESNYGSKIIEIVVNNKQIAGSISITDSEELNLINESIVVQNNKTVDDKKSLGTLYCKEHMSQNRVLDVNQSMDQCDTFITSEYNCNIPKKVTLSKKVSATVIDTDFSSEKNHEQKQNKDQEFKIGKDSKVRLDQNPSFGDDHHISWKPEPTIICNANRDITKVSNKVSAYIEICPNVKEVDNNIADDDINSEKTTITGLSEVKNEATCTEFEESVNSSIQTKKPVTIKENNEITGIFMDQKLDVNPSKMCIGEQKDTCVEDVTKSAECMKLEHGYSTSNNTTIMIEGRSHDSSNVALTEGLSQNEDSEIIEVSIVNLSNDEILDDELTITNFSSDIRDDKKLENSCNNDIHKQEIFNKLATEHTFNSGVKKYYRDSRDTESELITTSISKQNIIMRRSHIIKLDDNTDCLPDVNENETKTDINFTDICKDLEQKITLDKVDVKELNCEYEINTPSSSVTKLNNTPDIMTVCHKKCRNAGEISAIDSKQNYNVHEPCVKKCGQNLKVDNVLENHLTKSEALRNYVNDSEISSISYCFGQNINENFLESSVKEVTEIEIKGMEYEDPEIGTCFVFPIIEDVSELLDDDSQIDEGEEIDEIIQKEKSVHENLSRSDENEVRDADNQKKEGEVINDLSVLSNEPDIELIVPKQTYASHLMVQKSLKNMKRKKDMSDFKFIPKKYRKGKNIDYPKITATAMGETVYAKEYKRIIDYCSTVKFSYSIPFHIECIDVGDMLNAWPIHDGHKLEENDSDHVEDVLYTDIENCEPVPFIMDPLNQTLSDEIMNGNTVNSYKPIDINETNFSKGFGERSGRVIKELENGNIKSSAATLSDVKPHQPFSMSEDRNACHEIDKQNIKTHYFMNCFSLKEKVQSFFKNTAFKISYDLQKGKKYDQSLSNDSDLSNFPFGLTNMDFFMAPSTQTLVNIVQVGQLPVSANAQNPVTCDPRVTQVSDASPSQCSDENSPGEDSQATIETEYTELTTANITLPLQEYVQHHQSPAFQDLIASPTDDTANDSTMSIVKIELMEENSQEINQDNDIIYENDFSPLPNNNVEYSFDDTSNTIFNHSNNVDNTNMGNRTNDMFHTSTNMDNSFTNIFNATPTDNTFTDLNNCSPNNNNASNNIDDTASAMDKTTNAFCSTNVYNTNKEVSSENSNITSNLENTTENSDVVVNLENSFTTLFHQSNGMDKENTTVETTGTSINRTINLGNRSNDINIQNTNYDYSYENMQNYTDIENNNTNIDNYPTNVDSYSTNVQSYESNENNYANVENYGADTKFATDDENYASNITNYRNESTNYAPNLETFTPNVENSPSNIDHNNTNIDDASSNILEQSQPQDLSLANSPQMPHLRKLSTEKSQDKAISEKRDQIAHAMNAAGITSESSDNDELTNLINESAQPESFNTPVTANTHYSKTPIGVMTLQQALAQVLPPPLNQTGSFENNQIPNNPVTQQVLHIVQGSSAPTVINKPNGTHLLHIVQNKHVPTANGLSLVEGGLQQGNQLIHIVNNGKQNSTGQFLKRVNLLTNVANAQGSNEQKMIQFVCKSADGKAIQLNTGHQRSMVLRLHPTSVQTVTKPAEPQDLSVPTTSAANPITSQEPSEPDLKSRSVYDENYVRFVQNKSPPCHEKSTSLPKFNQVFGKQPYSENQNEINSNGSEHSDCQTQENNGHIEQTPEASSPPLLVRNPPPPETTQASHTPVQQIKKSISPFQTMHGGVIYTRQIPVNLGGQTINLITVPSTELVDEPGQKQQADANFGNQEGNQPSIIKLVPHPHAANSTNLTTEENNAPAVSSNDTSQIPQTQPVLTQMRIKLPMLSKGPHIVPGTRLIRPSIFQIQRNVIAGTNQPVYQQLVLTTAPSLAQPIRLPTRQAQPSQQAQSPQQTQQSPLVQVAQPAQQTRHVHQVQQSQQVQPNQHSKPDTEPDSELSTLTMEQLREFDMVLEQVKERSIVQPPLFPTCMKPIPYEPKTSADSTDSSATTTSVSESTQQVLYSVENNHPANVVSYVNRKSTITSATTSYVRSPDSSGIVETPSSSTQVQITHTVTSKSTTADHRPTAPPKKKKKKKKSSSSSSALAALNNSPSKASTLKPQEDEQTTQRILYILAEYKEQVENSPDKNKPAPRRRNQFPPTTGSKRKRSHCSSRSSCPHGEMSPDQGDPGENGDDSLITLGSEDSSCGTTFSECTECQESHSPEDSPHKVVRRLTFEQETTTQITQTRTLPQRNVIVGDGQTITVARTTTTAKPTTTVLMPANYLLPVSMIKGGQQIAIMTNRGPKLLVGAGDTNAGALLFQRLIGPGLKPVLARPGVRHIRLPTTALHNLQTFNIQTTPITQVQPPDSTAPQPQTPAPPDLVDTRAMSSPWQDRDAQDKPEREPSPDCTEPWSMPSSSIADDYGYEEIVRTDNMERTVLDAIPDRYSPDMEAQRIFDKMFDVDSKKSMYDSPRCGYDIDASDSDDKPYHQVVQQRKDGRHHRVTHVSTAALRHKYAILEHELRLQKSLSEECEDLGVDSPSASDLFPEADILFGAPSPAHEQTIDECNTPPPIPLTPVPHPDLDDQIATDQLLTPNVNRHEDLDLNLDDVGEIVTVGEDGIATIPTINPEEFARSHPNTTFHTEPEDGEIPPFTIAHAIKGRHITFHANRVPGTVVMAPQTTVISQACINTNDANNTVKFTDIDNMINSMPGPQHANGSTVVKDPTPKPMSKFDSLLQASLEPHLSLHTPAIVHSAGQTTQVIRRLRYDERTQKRFLVDEPRSSRSISDEVKLRNDRAMVESMGDNASSPGQPELFWDTTPTVRNERKFQFNESEKVTKSPFDELLNDSSAYGPHTRLDSVIKAARPERTYQRTSFEGISMSGSSDDSRPLRTYPPKRVPPPTQNMEKHFTKTMHHDLERNLKTSHHHELKKTLPRCQDEGRRRASGRGVVKRGCSCCNGSTTAPPKKKSRPKKPPPDFSNS